MREGAVWGVPGTGQIYKISHANKTFTLIDGEPNDPKHWHDMNKVTLAKLGYRVLDRPELPGYEQAFAEAVQMVSVFLEDEVAFDKQAATLQYRPYRTPEDGWKWFWVLLPDDKSRALASGTGDSRAQASTMARLKARKLGIIIQNVDLMEPHNQNT